MTIDPKIVTIDPKIMTNDPKIMTIDLKIVLLQETNLNITGPMGILGEIETIKRSSGNDLLTT